MKQKNSVSSKPLALGYKCECGRTNLFGGYVYAHWNYVLTHECECGKKNRLKGGKVLTDADQDDWADGMKEEE